MTSVYQTTTNSSARDRDTKLTAKQASLNADLPYEAKPRPAQKKVSRRLANPAYKNLSNHQ